MNIEKVLEILRAIAILDSLKQEQGSYRLSEVARWACMDRTTTWRYLSRMRQWKLIDVEIKQWAGKPCAFHKITPDGHDLIRVYVV